MRIGKEKDDERFYLCAICNKEYEKGWSDEDAEKELKEKFIGVEKEDCETVCDDCYNKYFNLN